MFSFFKKRPSTPPLDYPAEFRRLSAPLFEQFSIGHTPYEELLYAMRVIEKEMNENGGCNWRETEFIEFIETIRDVLLEEPTFTTEQQAKIRESINEIV